MIKKLLLVGAAVLLLVGLFAGTGIVSYVSTAVDRVQEQVKGNVPVNFEIDRARRPPWVSQRIVPRAGGRS